jgi:hypothetical protein
VDQARAALSGFSATTVLARAGAELEAVTARRQQARQERQWHPHVWKSPGAVERADQADSELAGQRAVLAALLEFTLAEPPSGTKTPDAVEWATLLGLADLYVQATIRSDGLRWNIDGEATAITDHYEVIRYQGTRRYSTSRRSTPRGHTPPALRSATRCSSLSLSSPQPKS